MARCFFFLLALGWLPLAALAHPVAQGAMEVLIHPDHVEVAVRAANEEVFVAVTLGPEKSELSLAELWQSHADYLRQHIHVLADGQTLEGSVVGVEPSPTPAATAFGIYLLSYALPAGAAPPAVVELRQDVLNELEFAPGNRWEATYVVRFAQAGGAGREALLFTSQAPLRQACDWSTPAAGAPPRLDRSLLFREYLHHGVFHILTGYDHMLFMAALVLAVASLLDLVKVVTAFTVAHTITLTLAVLHLVNLPPQIVEPMIAGSIVVVALQNVFWPRQTRGWSRLAVAFGFGLFHGLGFAGGLLGAMADLPGMTVAIAITAFSLGVELGHQAVVLPIYSALALARRWRESAGGGERVRLLAQRYGSAAVCVAGCVYLVAALRAP